MYNEQAVGLLQLYRQIYHQGTITVIDSPEERELVLSGLVLKREDTLRVCNRIYETIFNQSWINQQITILTA